MMTINVDGKPFLTDIQSLRTMGELVELIKASIDPDTIITSAILNGDVMAEEDWRSPLSAHGNATVDFETGSREQFLGERISHAAELVDALIASFGAVTESFKGGETLSGNKGFSGAVNDLQAFLGWYETLLALDPEGFQQVRETFHTHVDGIKDICERLVQQQLYQSWWAIGETLSNDLGPQLSGLKTFCLDVAAGTNAH